MIRETKHRKRRWTKGRIGRVVTVNSADDGKVPPRPEPHTRETLARAVRDKFGFDVSRLWSWMQGAKHLPQDLSGEWDPVWGPRGAWEHLRGRRSIQKSQRPKHGAARFSLVGIEIRPQCRLCGIAIAVLLCCYETITPIHARPHVRKMLRVIGSLIRRFRAMQSALVSNVKSYKESETQFVKSVFENARERQFEMKVDGEVTDDITKGRKYKAILDVDRWCQNAGKLVVLPTYPELWFDSWFDDMEKALRLLADDVVVNLHLPVLEAIWPPRSGRPTKMIAKVRTILRNDGFTWDEVAELVRDEVDVRDPDGARDRARSQVRAAQSHWR
jgi:hypothetical protein